VPGPQGADQRGGRIRTTGPIGAETDNGTEAELSYDAFKQAVLDAQIRGKRAEGKTFFAAVPATELDVIEGSFRMRKLAALRCRQLLADVRSALETETRADDGSAVLVTHIGIQSAYRDYAQDMRAWEKAFKTHYNKTLAARESLEGGPHGRAALQVLVRRMRKFKAPPGFSNHSNGTAVDFNTTQDGTEFVADSSQREGWKQTWLHRWLVMHAATYGFHPLATEEWHWDFK